MAENELSWECVKIFCLSKYKADVATGREGLGENNLEMLSLRCLSHGSVDYAVGCMCLNWNEVWAGNITRGN